MVSTSMPVVSPPPCNCPKALVRRWRSSIRVEVASIVDVGPVAVLVAGKV